MVVLGAAIYMGFPQGEAFNFMNRHYCLSGRRGSDGKPTCRIEAGKKFVPVFSQGAPDMLAYRSNYEAVTKPFTAWGFDVMDPIVVSGAAGGVKSEVLEKANALGKSL